MTISPVRETRTRFLSGIRGRCAPASWQGAALLMLLAVVHPASAQVPRGIQNPVPQGSPIPRILPPAPPSVAPGGLIAPPAGPTETLPAKPVRVTSVSIQGATAYPSPEISRSGRRARRSRCSAVPDRRGATGDPEPVPLRRLHPHHGLGGGGRAGTPALSGHRGADRQREAGRRHRAGRRASAALPEPADREQPIDSATLERYLLLAQDVPGVTLRATLQPSTEEPGALTLIASVSRQAISGLASVDNRAFNQTGPTRRSAARLQQLHRVRRAHRAVAVPCVPNSQTFGQGSIETFVGGSGLRVRLYAGSGRSNPSGSLGDSATTASPRCSAAGLLSGDPLAPAER